MECVRYCQPPLGCLLTIGPLRKQGLRKVDEWLMHPSLKVVFNVITRDMAREFARKNV